MTNVKYQSHGDLFRTLQSSVEQFFEQQALPKHGGARLLTKAFVIGSWFIASYVLLVFFAATWWQVALLALSLSTAVAAIGFNVQHDGGHKAFTSSRKWNRFFAFGLDLLGASSYLWNYKHNQFHHQHTNVDGVDEDLDAAPFLRLAPSQKRHWFHRFQHFYAWPLYGFLIIKWHLVDDFRNVARGRIGDHRIPRPKGRELLYFVLGKVLFFSWAFVIPSLLHPLPLVLLVYVFAAGWTGILLSVVFQLAHCVEETTFWVPPDEGIRMDHSWAAHQIATTADFAPRNRALTWFLGGLNFQVIHHLFPRISHVHYPDLAPLIEEACAKHGVRYVSVSTFRHALRSHFRFLRRLGQDVPGAA
jgi:linoleoyl-CoA desaturase